MRFFRSSGDYFLRRPVVVFGPAPPTQQQQTLTVAFATAITTRGDLRRRGTHPRFNGPVVVFDRPLARPIQATLVKTRPRHPASVLLPQAVAASTSPFVANPVQVNLQDNRVRGFGRRDFPGSVLHPPTVLQTFPGPQVALVRARPRPLRRFLFAPPAAVPASPFIATPVSVALVRSRPRHVTAAIGEPTVLQVFATGLVALVRSRPRPTLKALADPVVVRVPSVEQQEQTVRVSLVRTRPRPTKNTRLAPPTVLIVPQVIQAEDTIKVVLVRSRPRPTVRFLTAPTALAVFAGPRVSVARIRPRPTSKTLGEPTVVIVPAVVQAEDTIRVSLTHTRPRPTVKALRAPAALTVFTGPRVTLVHARPRPTSRHLSAPTILRVPSVEQSEQTIRTRYVTARPRPTGKRLSAPVVVAAATQPVITRLTVWLSLRTRVENQRRAAHTRLAPPTKVIPLPTLQMQTVKVSLVRTRPRPTRRFISPPAVLQVFDGPTTPLVHTRPRPTIHKVYAPAVVRVPSVEQAERTLRVSLTHTRPRGTVRSLTAPPAPPARTFTGPLVSLTRLRPRRTVSRLAAPTATIKQVFAVGLVALARSRPRPTTAHLGVPQALRTFAGAATHLARTRPRPTTTRLAAPTAVTTPLPVLHPITVTLSGRTRLDDLRRGTSRHLAPPAHIFGAPNRIRLRGPVEALWATGDPASGPPTTLGTVGTAWSLGEPSVQFVPDTPSTQWGTGEPS